jgi:hypothetical protein
MKNQTVAKKKVLNRTFGWQMDKLLDSDFTLAEEVV